MTQAEKFVKEAKEKIESSTCIGRQTPWTWADDIDDIEVAEDFGGGHGSGGDLVMMFADCSYAKWDGYNNDWTVVIFQLQYSGMSPESIAAANDCLVRANNPLEAWANVDRLHPATAVEIHGSCTFTWE